jgi:hypothetical protein
MRLCVTSRYSPLHVIWVIGDVPNTLISHSYATINPLSILYGDIFFADLLDMVQKNSPYQFTKHRLQMNYGEGSVRFAGFIIQAMTK